MTQANPHIDRAQGAAAPMPCWSCKQAAEGLFCGACGVVQPPGAIDHFQRLGLVRGFAVATADLDRRYFALQRQLHPDRFVKKTPRERAVSQSQAASLNDAYETLRDPLTRAVYLLRLQGIELEPSNGQTISDPALLMEAMEMREALAEAADDRAVDVVAAQVETERKDGFDLLGKAFAQNDMMKARAQTLRLKYLTKLAEDIRARRATLRAQGSMAS